VRSVLRNSEFQTPKTKDQKNPEGPRINLLGLVGWGRMGRREA